MKRSAPPRITQESYEALAEIRYQIRRFLVFSEAAARAAGIEPQQHQLLLALEGLPAGEQPAIRVLADRLQIQHHSAVELVSRSERKCLVRRHPSVTDRREVTLKITPRGRRVLLQLSLAHRAELESAAPILMRALRAIVMSSRLEGRKQ